MSRRGRAFPDACGDCGASDPSWASVNRGILLCAECCSVHRSMGRHISHVKSLHQGAWPPTLLSMINAMTAQNVNCIWEHSLLDPTSKIHRKKPQPKDPIPVKSEFIKAKHQKLTYAFRPRKDDVPCSIIELSRQLHSSVRSANLDTSLRLLVQGADPNYFNQEKGTSCLHVACRTGNSSQAELLVAWGADPNVKDITGNTPSASARLGGHIELADRMLELVYEVTDRLSYYLCNKKPNHKNGQHYISLDKVETHEMTDLAKTARGKLQLLPNHLFEELVMDIYDEIDRRECEAVWLTSAIGLERYGVAFLPVNPVLSAPRNQGRQKLARLSPVEMAALLRDILMDANRRQHIATLKPTSLASSIYRENLKSNILRQVPHISDDEPLYDSVASDDDYAALLPLNSDETADNKLPKITDNLSRNVNVPPSDESVSRPLTQDVVGNNVEHDNNPTDVTKNKEIEMLKEQLTRKDLAITDLKSKLDQLQNTVECLKMENMLLKKSTEKKNSLSSRSSPQRNEINSVSKAHNVSEPRNDSSGNSIDLKSINKTNQRPNSMYETREISKYNWQMSKQQFSSMGNDPENNENDICNIITEDGTLLPEADEVHKHTEVVTKGIQELWAAMQDPNGQGYSFGSKADKIKMAVDHLVSIFPKKNNEKISPILCQLSLSCQTLEVICGRWSNENIATENDLMMDSIRSAAYDLAKAAKSLVSNFPVESNN